MASDIGIDDNAKAYVEAQQILLAAAHHDLESLRIALKTTSANVQDDGTLYTPLHTAIASCTPMETSSDPQSTQSYDDPDQGKKEEQAAETLKLLLMHGAIWNDLDANNETPGCLAYRLGLKSLYEIMVDAGVRAELLLNRLDAFQPLMDVDDEEEDEDEDEDVIDLTERDTPQDGDLPSISLQAPHDDSSTLSPNYLSSTLSFTNGRVLDSAANAVMMSWESVIMERSASALMPTAGLRVLNIGFGMGIFDSFVQKNHAPAAHHIVEAHPDILANMKETGWDSSDTDKYVKKDVTIHAGTWQSVLPQLVEQNLEFDAIYFDTFAEGYNEFRDFFSEYVVALLAQRGTFSYFNGGGADRQICYDVSTKVAELDLLSAGFDVEWIELDTPATDWDGVRRKYFDVAKYRLPVCHFMG